MTKAMAPITTATGPFSQAKDWHEPTPPIGGGVFIYVIAVIVIFFGVFGGIAAIAPLDSAAIAPGVVSLKGNRKVVQHLDGGLIREIHVREGDYVSAGQPLVTMDQSRAETVRAIILGRLTAARALSARLKAERDKANAIAFDFNANELETPEVRDAVKGQTGIFNARRDALRSQRDILTRRVGQLQAEIKGLKDQIEARTRQANLIDTEISNVSALVDKGLERQSRLLSLQRDQAGIDNALAIARASIARGEQRIGETRLQADDVYVRFIGEVVEKLQDVEDEIFDQRERLRDAETTLGRTVIKAGLVGTIVDLKVFTVGGVIAPGQELMSLVPASGPMIVEARVNTNDIDVVRAGSDTRVRLTAFSQRSVDVVPGRVLTISADRLTDPFTNLPYYLAIIELDTSNLGAEIARQIKPGMGAEVMIRSGEQTLIDYLLKPIRASISRALTEG